MENRSEQYIHITKRGLLIIKDLDGTSYYFDPTNSLKDVAAYIMSNPSLSHITSEPDKTNDDADDGDDSDGLSSPVDPIGNETVDAVDRPIKYDGVDLRHQGAYEC